MYESEASADVAKIHGEDEETTETVHGHPEHLHAQTRALGKAQDDERERDRGRGQALTRALPDFIRDASAHRREDGDGAVRR